MTAACLLFNVFAQDRTLDRLKFKHRHATARQEVLPGRGGYGM